jgi:hypothetical protein
LAGESGYNSYGNKTGGRKEGSIIFLFEENMFMQLCLQFPPYQDKVLKIQIIFSFEGRNYQLKKDSQIRNGAIALD